MIEVNNKKNVKQCEKCLRVLSFDMNDVKQINQGGYEEYVIICPVCGKHNPICYINGVWK